MWWSYLLSIACFFLPLKLYLLILLLGRRHSSQFAIHYSSILFLQINLFFFFFMKSHQHGHPLRLLITYFLAYYLTSPHCGDHLYFSCLIIIYNLSTLFTIQSDLSEKTRYCLSHNVFPTALCLVNWKIVMSTHVLCLLCIFSLHRRRVWAPRDTASVDLQFFCLWAFNSLRLRDLSFISFPYNSQKKISDDRLN